MSAFIRRDAKCVDVAGVKIGGGNPISIQSMTNTDTRDVNATVNQILELERAGCEIIRVAIPDMTAAEAVGDIVKKIHIPLVTDIHFDYRLALKCIENGADKVRINPGNIGDEDRIKQVVDAAKGRKIPIRIGINAGSLEKSVLEKYGRPTPEGMVESALHHIAILERYNFNDIVISLKASSVPMTIDAYKLMATKCNYPLHVGVTEAGTISMGSMKAALGIGSLLSQGIGDTIRVSLTSDPINEVKVARDILKHLEIRKYGPKLVSCPTCGRCRIDLIPIAEEIERRLESVSKHITVAVMGCAVNGPGEAKEADVGVAGGNGEGLIFRKGEIIRKVPGEDIVKELMAEIDSL